MRELTDSLRGRRASIVTAFALGAIGLAPTIANASCGNRPGTPNQVTMTGVSQNSVEVKWRNTTGKTFEQPTMYFDMYFRNGANQPIGRDLTGTGPFQVSYGSFTTKVFDGLAPNTRYCFSLRARSSGGTQGCISAITSNTACANTLAVNAPPPPPPPPAVSSKPSISAAGKPNNTIVISGGNFLRNAPVTIRVTDQTLPLVLITTIGGQRIMSDRNGNINLTFTGLCKHPGILFFSANDGRSVPSSVDFTGTLWTNTARITCT